MDNNVRTIYGAYFQTCNLLGIDVNIKLNSTLNQKFDIYKDEVFLPGQQPIIKYMTIGNGGHKSTIGAEGIPLINPVPHSPRHAALYNHLPFIIREPSDDLSVAERAKYRLRTMKTFNGVQYVCYYARALDLIGVVPTTELRNVTNGIITATNFDPSIADLNPIKPNIPLNGNITSTGNSLAATAKLVFTMDRREIDELLHAVNIMYGDDNYAFISEMGLFAGADRTLMGDFNGTQIAYNEVIGATMVNFISTAIPAFAINTSIEQIVDIGATEPLLFN